MGTWKKGKNLDVHVFLVSQLRGKDSTTMLQMLLKSVGIKASEKHHLIMDTSGKIK